MASWDRDLPAAIDAAIRNVATFGDTDLFMDPVEAAVLRASPARVRAQVLRLHRDLTRGARTADPEPLRALFPVGSTGYRLGTQLDPVWNLYLLALVILAGPRIECRRMSSTLERVYSYRFITPDSRGRIFDPDTGWRMFTERTAVLAAQHAHVVVCDIADFYPRVGVSMIKASLSEMGVAPGLIQRLCRVLERIKVDPYGLPVGGPASRLLAEALLSPVDQGLLQAQITHCRFVDDIRLFARSMQEAHGHLAVLSGMLSGQGLSLQKSKTRIVAGRELIDEITLAQSLQLVPTKGGAAGSVELRRRLLALRPTDPYAGLRTQAASDLEDVAGQPGLAALLRREFSKAQVQPALARNLVASLRFMQTPDATRSMLFLLDPERLPTVLPVLNRLLHTVYSLAPGLEFDAACRVRAALLALLEHDSLLRHLSATHAQVVRVLGALPSDRSEATMELLVRCHEASSEPLLRREITLLWGAWGSTDVLNRLACRAMPKTQWERRALLWALRQCEVRQGVRLPLPRWAQTPTGPLAPWARWLRCGAARTVLKEAGP